MIDWNAFYANGGYYGENDPQCYDDGHYEEFDEEDSEEEKEEDELYPMETMDKEALNSIKEDSVTSGNGINEKTLLGALEIVTKRQ